MHAEDRRRVRGSLVDVVDAQRAAVAVGDLDVPRRVGPAGEVLETFVGSPQGAHERRPYRPSIVTRRRQETQAERGELRRINGSRGARHRVGAGLRLRKRDHFADVLLAREDRHEPVDADREPAVRRRAIAERSEEEAEARGGFLGADAEQVEDALLQLRLVDPDRSASRAPIR